MPNSSMALVLTSTEARALFDAAALGLSKRAESGMASNDKVVDALQKIQQQMELASKIKDPVSGNGAAGVRTCRHFGEPAVADLD